MYGSVYEGFDPVSGDLRIVKAFEVKDRKAGEALEPELTINRRFGATPGLVRQYGWSNSDGDLDLKVRTFPVQVYLVMEKGLDFSRHNWNEGGSELPTTRTKLCQDLLKGLAAIHTAGWMHRNITVQNILFFEATDQPPQAARAALCDFGKLFFGRTDNNTALAAWQKLPPEIVKDRSNIYSQSIDLWMLALALTRSWYPQSNPRRPGEAHNQLSIEELDLMRDRLQIAKDSGLASLLRSMLAENPIERPTAIQALMDPCFRNIEGGPIKAMKYASHNPF